MMTRNDIVFGQMEYANSWVKTEMQFFFGRELLVRIVARAFADEEISEEQRLAYKRYLDNQNEYIRNTPSVLLAYYLDNYDYIESTVEIPDVINRENINEELIVKLIKVRTIYFDREGQYGWLCDCAWDEEHGICILLSDPIISIQEQDYLL